ncbi:GPP34 family phosphoprotein [uncultured Streptomyces sp.]|uniref:GOLPH3/VPS74 family protein n=1 Tax=uncultured Streptomyces sp. TaxID=174707 RepID=UPI002608D84E|nr:GPP34 family phosphoprotein [uncultured Streptomyces sp.]
MSTAKDLFIIALRPGPHEPVGQGDLSLALAGAELIDLVGAGAVTVEGDRIVPGGARVPGDDRLLREAAAAVIAQEPYERIEDWLWRRGRDLAAGYQQVLEEDGELTRKRSGWSPFGPERVEPVGTAASRRAADRWAQGDPVLAELASAVGFDGGRTEDGGRSGDGGDDGARTDEGRADDDDRGGDGAATSVLASVHDAVRELEAVRQRRTIENAAFANLWRGP